MTTSSCRRALSIPLFLLVLLLPSWARDAHGRIQRIPESDAPAPVLPLAGVRIDESATRFEVSSGAGVTDLRIVVARFPFEPSGW